MELMGNSLDIVRNKILLTNYHMTFGGEKYDRIVVTNVRLGKGKVIPFLILLPDEDIKKYKVGKDNIEKQKILLPKTLDEVVQCIDKAKKGEISYIDALFEADRILSKSMRDKSARSNDYQIYKSRLNKYAEKLYTYFTHAINEEIRGIKRRQLQALPGYNPNDDNELLIELNFINVEIQAQIDTMKRNQPSKQIDYISQIKNLMEIISNVEKNKLAEQTQSSERKHGKLKRFFDKKIFPYMESLSKAKDLNPRTVDVNADLNFIIKDLINNYNNVHIDKNLLDEIVIHTSDGQVFNLTQILRAEPDFSSLKLEESDLDQYYNFLKSDAKVLKPSTNFPVDYLSVDPNTFKMNLDIALGPNHNFANLHAAEALGINIYSSAGYMLMNMLSRKKTLSDDIFVDLPTDRNAKTALVELEKNLRKTNDQTDLTNDERAIVIKETLMAIIVATLGLTHAKHLSYDPSVAPELKGGELSSEWARSLRGAAGTWTDAVKKLYAMAYIGGTPMYLEGFSSSSFKPDAIVNFMQDPNKMVTKALSVGLTDDKEGVAVMINLLSQYPDEKECLYRPGCLMLVAPEATIKNPSSYGVNVDKKVSVIFTSGTSPNSYFYSSEITKIREQLIDLLGKDLIPLTSNAAGADIITLKQIEQLLNASISKLKTQYKTVDVYLTDGVPQPNLLSQLPPHVSAAYVLTKSNEIYYLNKDKHTIIPLKISVDDFKNVVDNLNISTEFQQFTTGFEPVCSSINLVIFNYLQKVTQQPEIEKSYTAQESLKILQKTFKEIIHNILPNLSPSQEAELRKSFLPKFLGLETKVASRTMSSFIVSNAGLFAHAPASTVPIDNPSVPLKKPLI